MAELALYISDVLIRCEYKLADKITFFEEVLNRFPVVLNQKLELLETKKLKFISVFIKNRSINKKASVKIDVFILGPAFFSSKINHKNFQNNV